MGDPSGLNESTQEPHTAMDGGVQPGAHAKVTQIQNEIVSQL